MIKSLTRNSFLGALIAVAVSVGVIAAPAKAADPVTLTIWTFGEVIQPGLQREYQKLHPEVKIVPIKNDVDPLHQRQFSPVKLAVRQTLLPLKHHTLVTGAQVIVQIASKIFVN